jgi:hypothetical protein
MQKGLALSFSTLIISPDTIFFDGAYVSAHSIPTTNLPLVFFGHPATRIIATVPLKPSPGIILVNPTFGLPMG